MRTLLGYAGSMRLPSPAQIDEAQSIVYRYMAATPQYTWPLLNQRLAGFRHLYGQPPEVRKAFVDAFGLER